jgi:hypothetical protein
MAHRWYLPLHVQRTQQVYVHVSLHLLHAKRTRRTKHHPSCATPRNRHHNHHRATLQAGKRIRRPTPTTSWPYENYCQRSTVSYIPPLISTSSASELTLGKTYKYATSYGLQQSKFTSKDQGEQTSYSWILHPATGCYENTEL